MGLGGIEKYIYVYKNSEKQRRKVSRRRLTTPKREYQYLAKSYL